MTSTPAWLEGGQGESGPDAKHQQSQHLWTARHAVTLWAVRPRGPVRDRREDGPEAAHLHTAQCRSRAVALWASGSSCPVKHGREDRSEAAQQQTVYNSPTASGRPAGPGVSREPRSGRRRWDEGVDVSAPAAPGRVCSGCTSPSRSGMSEVPARPAGREPLLAAIRPVPVR